MTSFRGLRNPGLEDSKTIVQIPFDTFEEESQFHPHDLTMRTSSSFGVKVLTDDERFRCHHRSRASLGPILTMIDRSTKNGALACSTSMLCSMAHKKCKKMFE